jgi:hypothetical protein
MTGHELARWSAVQNDPGLQRGGDFEGLKHLRPGGGQIALGDHLLEIDPEFPQQQVIGVEPSLGPIEDVIRLEIERRSRLVLDVAIDDGGERAEISGDAIQSGQKIVGATFEHRRACGQAAIVIHQRGSGRAVLRL